MLKQELLETTTIFDENASAFKRRVRLIYTDSTTEFHTLSVVLPAVICDLPYFAGYQFGKKLPVIDCDGLTILFYIKLYVDNYFITSS